MKRFDVSMIVIGVISFFLGIVCLILTCVFGVQGIKKEVESGNIKERIQSGIEYVNEHSSGIVVDGDTVRVGGFGQGINVTADGNNVSITDDGIVVSTADGQNVTVDIDGIDIDEDAIDDLMDQIMG